MKARVHEKERAIQLRRKGYSYNDIIKEIPVAKSSLSLWLSDLPLTEEEKQYLKDRRSSLITRGRIRAAATHRANRLKKEKKLYLEAREQFYTFIHDSFFPVGVVLYWAEGAKRTDMYQFSNSDPEMVDVMLRWIERFLNIERKDIFFRLYMHKPYAHENWEEYWARALGVPRGNFRKTIFKPTGLGVKKRPNYKGCLRVEVARSTNLRRKMIFWISILVEYYKRTR